MVHLLLDIANLPFLFLEFRDYTSIVLNLFVVFTMDLLNQVQEKLILLYYFRVLFLQSPHVGLMQRLDFVL